MSKARKLVDLGVYYCMFVSWALLLHILYAVYCHLCCAKGSHSGFMPRGLLLDIRIVHLVYTVTDTTVCIKDTAASHIVCCVPVHVCTMATGASYVYCKLYTATCFLPWILLLHTYIVGCVLLHSLCHCHCYILYILYVLYCNMFCAKDTAAPYFKFCHGHSLTWFHGCYCFICMYIACSRYVCCMLCTGMFRLLVSVLYILLKALPRVCMENTARGGMSRDKYSRRQSRVLYLPRDTSPSAVFFVQTSKGSALSGILYFE